MKTAVIATPVYNGCHEHFAASLEAASHELPKFGWTVIPKMQGSSLLSYNRCGIAADFLYNKRADVLLWIDSDEGWSASDAAAVLEATTLTPLVAGAVRMKYATLADLPWEAIAEAARAGMPDDQLQFVGQQMAFGFRPEDIDAERGYVGPTKTRWGRKLIRVERAGTGFFAMRRDALLAIAERAPKVDGGMPILFNNDVTNKFVGEDTYFCRLAREAGYEIWLDTETLVTHYGSIGVAGDLRDERLHDLARREATAPR